MPLGGTPSPSSSPDHSQSTVDAEPRWTRQEKTTSCTVAAGHWSAIGGVVSGAQITAFAVVTEGTVVITNAGRWRENPSYLKVFQCQQTHCDAIKNVFVKDTFDLRFLICLKCFAKTELCWSLHKSRE